MTEGWEGGGYRQIGCTVVMADKYKVGWVRSVAQAGWLRPRAPQHTTAPLVLIGDGRGSHMVDDSPALTLTALHPALYRSDFGRGVV